MNPLIQAQVDAAIASVRREKDPLVVDDNATLRVSKQAGIRVRDGELIETEIFNERPGA